MAWLRTLFPVSRAGMALWAWRNRREVGNWLGFAKRAVPRLAGTSRPDLIAEARLRGSLSRDPRTRGIGHLGVRVVDGEAVLEGAVPPDAHVAAYRIAERTKGVRAVRCRIQDRGRSRRTRAPAGRGRLHW